VFGFVSGPVPAPAKRWAKVDWAVDEANQLSVRFNRQNFTGVNNEFTGRQAAEEHSGDSLAKTTTLAANLTSTFTTTLVNEFRVQFARDEEPGTNNSEDPELQIRSPFGTLFFGRNNFSPRETTINRAQVVENLSWVRGAHNVKGGADFVTDSTLNFFPGSFGGIYVFNSFADFQNNNPATFTQRFAGAGTGPLTKPNTRDLGFYLQDDWRVTPRLTVNAGVRYDYQHLADPPIRNNDPALLAAGLDTGRVPDDRNNFAPRLGFSYSPDERSVFRGGYGMFYGRTTGILLGTAHSGNGIQTTGVTLTGASAIAAAGLRYPNILPALPAGGAGRADLFLFSEDFQQPVVHQARFGYEREVVRDLSLSATYLFYGGENLTRTRDINLGTPVATTFAGPAGTTDTFTVLRFPATRPFTAYNRISLFEDSARSRYHGLAIQANRRFADNFQLLANYTYSVAKDNKPDQTAVVPGGGDDAKIVQNQLDPEADYSYADTDLRHRAVISPVYSLGRVFSESGLLSALLSDFTFSGIAQLQSGFAYTATVNADINRDGNARNDRVPGTERNGFRTPAVYQFDARVTRRIPVGERASVRLILEGFNIFNRANVLTTNTNFFNGFATLADGTLRFNAPSAATPFGAPRSFLSPRELQLAIKFDF
jgi:outer membrane receptor protein involved in Fe transport